MADHKVHGEIIVPAAALLEMASAAAADVLGPSVLEDVVFQEALALPANGGVRRVQLVFSPEDGERCTLRLISVNPAADDEGGWRLHVTAIACKARDAGDGASITIASLRARCGEPVDVAQYYRWLREIGIALGPAFQRLEELSMGNGEALARVRLHEAAPTSALYGIDPTLLDAGLWPWGPPCTPGARRAYVPFALETLKQHRQAGAGLWSHARLRGAEGAGREKYTTDITLLDDDGRVVVEVEGLRLKRLDRAALVHSDDEFAQWLYAVDWRPAPLAVGSREQAPAGLPSPVAIAARVEPGVEALAALHDISVYDQLLPALDVLCSAYVVNAFRLLGWTPRLGEHVSVGGLTDRLGIKNHHRRLLGHFLEMLVEDGLLQPLAPKAPTAGSTAEWEVVSLPESADPQALSRELAARFPEACAEREITARCGDQLAAALRGECDPLGLLFPGGSFAMAERLYQESPSSRVFQTLVREAVAAAVSHCRGTARCASSKWERVRRDDPYVLPVLPAGARSTSLRTFRRYSCASPREVRGVSIPAF